MTEEMINAVERRVYAYTNYREVGMTDMMLREVRAQYVDMARGGDGSSAGNGEIRNTYYKDMPDEFFQAVCDRLEWSY